MSDSIVFFTQRVESVESYNERRDCADQRISRFIKECGYLPLPVPNDPDLAKELFLEVCPKAIVLTGGNSLVKYGGNAPERDQTDRVLIQLAENKRTPIYGFCRGMQSILDYFGNELVDVSGHVAVRHVIGGLEEDREVNSYHNQACVELRSTQLESIMKSTDGVIEMIRHKSLPMVGTMWHPERNNPFDDKDIKMLKKLIETGEGK